MGTVPGNSHFDFLATNKHENTQRRGTIASTLVAAGTTSLSPTMKKAHELHELTRII